MANVGGPYNNQPQPDLQAFENAAGRVGNNKQIKIDNDTGNVGTRSFLGRAWRAVTPAFSGRRESNRSDIERFKTALLNQNNKQSNVGKALDKYLPGHESGNVPLTAGAVRRSIEYVNIQGMTFASAVDTSQFRDFVAKERATENLNFYLEAREILGDGNNIIDAKEFKELFDRFVAPKINEERNAFDAAISYEGINISGKLQGEVTEFVTDNDVQEYNDEQSMKARQLLQDAKVEVTKMLRDGALSRLQSALRKELDQR